MGVSLTYTGDLRIEREMHMALLHTTRHSAQSESIAQSLAIGEGCRSAL